GLGVAADAAAARPGLDISSLNARPPAEASFATTAANGAHGHHFAEGPPPVRRSGTLAAARAQSARLQTYLIDLKARIVPYHWQVPRAIPVELHELDRQLEALEARAVKRTPA